MNTNTPRTRSLQIALPMECMDSGPCTPTYEFPVTLPPQTALAVPDVSGLSLGRPLTPSPQVTGKRDRGTADELEPEKEWDTADLELLQNILDRPPKQALYPPGSMPPPQILDQLTTAIVTQCGRNNGEKQEAEENSQVENGQAATNETADTSVSGTDDGGATDQDPSPTRPVSIVEPLTERTQFAFLDNPMDGDGYDASCEPSPAPSEPVSRVPSPNPIPGWAHTWEETRRMLASLALADTRLGQAREQHKLTREERLARPSIKRVSSMDFLDEESSDAQPSEKLGRVLRLSTQLQTSVKESAELTRAASFGPSQMPTARCPSPSPRTASQPLARPTLQRTTPPVAFNRPSLSPQVRPSLMRRQSSGRSDRSPRPPSLLVRGRSFTASDLEAEVEAELNQTFGGSDTSTLGLVDMSPRTPVNSIVEPSNEYLSSRRHTSGPEFVPPPMMRSQSYTVSPRREPRPEPRVTSQDYGGIGRQNLGLRLPPAPVHKDILEPAFKVTTPTKLSNTEWDSDSDREGAISVKRRAPRAQLALTTMGSGSGPAAARPPKLVINEALAMSTSDVGLRSPFEERPMPV